MIRSLFRYRPAFALLIITLISLSACRPPISYHAGPNLKFHERMRDFIQTDTLTRRVFKHPDPLRVWVLDETVHLGIDTWDYEGVLKWIGSRQGRMDELRSLEDSLQQFAPHTSRQGEIIPELRELSTTDDITYTVVFMNIDSVLVPGYYILAACLVHNTCREYTSSDLLSARMTWYTLIMGKDTEVHMAISGGPWIPEYWDPCY